MVQTKILSDPADRKSFSSFRTDFGCIYFGCFQSQSQWEIMRKKNTAHQHLIVDEVLSCIYEDGFVRLNETACGRIIFSKN